MVRKGEPWERPATGPAETGVQGSDAELAAAARTHPGARLAFDPADDSDLARALGLGWGPADRVPGSLELPLDAMTVRADDAEHFAVNMVVLGTPPDRLGALSPRVATGITIDGRPTYDAKAISVLVANGQYLRGADAVPRGHPGDGRLEVQAYAPTVGEARAMRDRLATGTHVPHPRIAQAAGRRVEIRFARPVRLELDGVERGRATVVVVEVVPEAFSIVV
ncbi:MAG: hypothetical protein U0W40_20365 [Acidimicrobiia bacterium]